MRVARGDITSRRWLPPRRADADPAGFVRPGATKTRGGGAEHVDARRHLLPPRRSGAASHAAIGGTRRRHLRRPAALNRAAAAALQGEQRLGDVINTRAEWRPALARARLGGGVGGACSRSSRASRCGEPSWRARHPASAPARQRGRLALRLRGGCGSDDPGGRRAPSATRWRPRSPTRRMLSARQATRCASDREAAPPGREDGAPSAALHRLHAVQDLGLVDKTRRPSIHERERAVVAAVAVHGRGSAHGTGESRVDRRSESFPPPCPRGARPQRSSPAAPSRSPAVARRCRATPPRRARTLATADAVAPPAPDSVASASALALAPCVFSGGADELATRRGSAGVSATRRAGGGASRQPRGQPCRGAQAFAASPPRR